jgi:hypothetical protein
MKNRMLVPASLFFFLALFAAPNVTALGQAREQDHEELRTLLRAATEAMNTKNFDALLPLFNDRFSITTVDQRLFTSLADFKAYYDNLFNGSNAPLKNIEFKPVADDLTAFVGDNVGLSYGTSTDTYLFSDGDTRTMTSRWTATVFKRDGKWKILNIHIGTNLLDNPVVSSLKSTIYKSATIAVIVGLALGFAIAWFLRGRARGSRE